MTAHCAATTKAGTACKNKAREDSNYCYAHRNFVSAETPTPEPIETIEEIPVAEEATIDGGGDERFQRIVGDLNKVVDDLKNRAPNFVPPAFSPQRLAEMLKENVDRVSVDSKLVKDLQEQVEGKSAQDFLERETWEGLWYVLNYSLQERSESLRTTVSETLNEQLTALRNSEAVAGFQKNVKIESAQDLLSADTWKSVFNIASETLQAQAAALRERMQTQNNDTA